MAFPQTLLRWTAEAALGADLTQAPSTWTQWTDVTAFVQAPNGIVLGRGRASEFSTAPAATSAATMINTDGRWVERNPLGVWYGLIGFNTPLRYLIAADANTASDTFNRVTANGFGTATSGGAWTVIGTAADYATTGTVAEITHPSAAVRHYAVLPTTLTTLDVTVRVRTGALATGAALSAGVVFRYVDASNSLRYEVLFNVDQTIGVRAVLRTSGIDSFGASHLAVGLAHAASTFYRVRVQTYTADGKSFRAKIWADNASEPSTWTAYSSTAFPAPVGKVGLTSQRETGNTNANAVVDFDDYGLVDGPVRRHTGYINSLPRRWADHSATVLYAPITAPGLTKRLEQGDVLASAIKRGVLTAGITPRAYWTCEDKTGSTQLASAIPGGLPMRITQPMTLASGQAAGSDPLIVVSNLGRIQGTVQPYTGTDWTVMALINIPAAVANGQAILQWSTSGSYPIWQLVLTPQAGPDLLQLQAYDNTFVERIGDVGANFTDDTYGKQMWIEVSAQQVGADISWSYFVWTAGPGAGAGSGTGKAGTKTGATAGTVTGMSFGNGSGANLLAGSTLGHLSAWDTASITLGSFGSTGWAGEQATSRWTRLAAQETTALSLVGAPTYDFATMGAPTSSTLLTQLREVEQVEQGILYDELDGSVALLPREFRTNRAVDLTLDLAAGNIAVLEPDNDDQQVVNDVTSAQPTGTSYQYTDTTSTRSSAKGFYSKPAPVNLFFPQDLRQDAEYRTALGTVDEDRYTTIEVSLTGNPSLIPAWLACNIGSRIQLVNTASLYTPDPVDLILEGYQETIFAHDWRITLYTSSAKPWNAWILETGTGNQSKLDSGTSAVAGPVTSSATTIPVTTSDLADLWTTLGADFPFDVGAAGERMTVSTIGALLVDTFTRTTSSSWGTADTGQSWTTAGGSASDYSTNGTQGIHNLSTTVTQRLSSLAMGLGPVEIYADWIHVPTAPTGSGTVTCSLTGCKPDANNYIELQLFATVGGTMTVAVVQVAGGAVVAQDSTFPSVGALTSIYSARLHITSTTIQGRVWVRGTTEPTTWTTSVAVASTPQPGDVAWRTERSSGVTNAAPYFVELDGLSLPNCQAFTVTRHVNNVTKAQSATDAVGNPTRIGLWNPSVLAL